MEGALFTLTIRTCLVKDPGCVNRNSKTTTMDPKNVSNPPHPGAGIATSVNCPLGAAPHPQMGPESDLSDIFLRFWPNMQDMDELSGEKYSNALN